MPAVLNRWRKEFFLENATTIFEVDSAHEADQHRIADSGAISGATNDEIRDCKKKPRSP